MESTTVTNPLPNSNSDRVRRKKKKKTSAGAATATLKTNQQRQNQNQSNNHTRWKSEAQQQIYSSKLIQALSQVNLNGNHSSPSAPRRGRAVREAADRALAVAAKGRTRWSRAILTSRVKLKFRKEKGQRSGSVSAATVTGVIGRNRSRKQRFSVLKLKAKSVQRKVKVIGRLVPGCRKQPLPVILEEATDYIAALEMQVRAMSALADLLSGSGSATSSSPPTSQ
ncbi:hypothetical protein PVK06_032894 [Gossypium arboreum]|uniref:BHLH domain-containing protein n=1 Tax=Gossypium arboreum TaxID=29729 RepID=A0ABR0NWA7_GOSAR|nr:hypothetical protein PVK06_032894 [Gossypium arboreum]